MNCYTTKVLQIIYSHNLIKLLNLKLGEENTGQPTPVVNDKTDEVLQILKQRLEIPKPDHKYDSLGTHWAYKLSRLQKEQCIYAEKLIHDMFEQT